MWKPLVVTVIGFDAPELAILRNALDALSFELLRCGSDAERAEVEALLSRLPPAPSATDIAGEPIVSDEAIS